jgi:imidazole glycerol-phosphate synthase subunit HisH
LIRIVDYGVGNIDAFLSVFRGLGIPASRARGAAELREASKLILPGVGAFDHAMDLLNRSGLREVLDERVLGDGVPVLGVCVGMQIMAGGSEEGVLNGLGWIPGRVRALSGNPACGSLPVPHMGWNDMSVRRDAPLLRGFEPAPRFYFLHSYYLECSNAAHVAATASYGIDFACAVASGGIHGVQFHPEKSHRSGAQLLRNFAEL